ncbi:MAG: hypothetical protein J7501_15810 [Bdellovibrio sp.]|nr:hypothetical protein [Bdellovibrio sp.]
MKMLLSAALLALALVGSTSHAYEGTIAMGPNGEVKMQPLRGQCDEIPQPALVGEMESQGACKPSTAGCPAGYDRAAKFCWAGWHKGFYRCGYACQPKTECTHGPHYDPRCGNPGSGGRGHN